MGTVLWHDLRVEYNTDDLLGDEIVSVKLVEFEHDPFDVRMIEVLVRANGIETIDRRTILDGTRNEDIRTAIHTFDQLLAGHPVLGEPQPEQVKAEQEVSPMPRLYELNFTSRIFDHYLPMTMQAAGLNVDSENHAEVRDAIDEIAQALAHIHDRLVKLERGQ